MFIYLSSSLPLFPPPTLTSHNPLMSEMPQMAHSLCVGSYEPEFWPVSLCMEGIILFFSTGLYNTLCVKFWPIITLTKQFRITNCMTCWGLCSSGVWCSIGGSSCLPACPEASVNTYRNIPQEWRLLWHCIETLKYYVAFCTFAAVKCVPCKTLIFSLYLSMKFYARYFPYNCLNILWSQNQEF